MWHCCHGKLKLNSIDFNFFRHGSWKGVILKHFRQLKIMDHVVWEKSTSVSIIILIRGQGVDTTFLKIFFFYCLRSNYSSDVLSFGNQDDTIDPRSVG